MDFNYSPPGEHAPLGWQLERPDDPEHHRNQYPHPAPTYLVSHLNRIMSLEIIPGEMSGRRDLYTKQRPKYPKDQEGSPRTIWLTLYDFREAEWKAESERIWERIRRDEPTYQPSPDRLGEEVNYEEEYVR